MSWYKSALNSLYAPRMVEQPKVEVNPDRLFNLIKKQNLKIRGYHGTNLTNYKKASLSGYLLSNSRVSKSLSGSKKGFVYFSTNSKIAENYARKLAGNFTFKGNDDDRTAVVITLDIPLYAIAEIRQAIFGGVSGQNLTGDDLDKYVQTTIGQDEETIKRIYQQLQKAEELTVQFGLPLKWQVSSQIVHKYTSFSFD